jgi:plastocyanin
VVEASVGRRNARRSFGAAVLALALLAAAACGGGSDDQVPPTPVAPTDGALTIEAFEWGFEPEAIVVRLGEEVTFVFRNEGDILHNLKIDDFVGDVTAQESSGPLEGDEGDFFVGAEVDDEGTITFVASGPGEYAYYCDISGHRGYGMEGTLTVE